MRLKQSIMYSSKFSNKSPMQYHIHNKAKINEILYSM